MSATHPSGASPGALRIDVLRTAEIPMPRGYAFRSQGSLLARLGSGLNTRGPTLLAPCLAYVVRHPTAGVIVIDTGMHPAVSSNPRADFGLGMSLLFRGLRPAEPFDRQLKSVGVEPEQVERVVMTHLHADHTSGMRLLPKATFLCASEEWAAANGRFATANGYVARHLPGAERMELLEFSRDGEPLGPFERTIDLLGDGTVRLLFTPGHTHGHLSLLLEAEDRRVLIVGDAAYTLRSIDEQILPMLTVDDRKYADSLRALKSFAEHEPEVILVPTHDPDAWRALESAALPDGA